MPSHRSTILKRLGLAVPLLICIFGLLTDNQTHEGMPPHHLAIATALARHPPSLRVFRSLLELNLLLWCVAFSLWVWSGTVGSRMVGHLLFGPIEGEVVATNAREMIRENGAYESVSNYRGDSHVDDEDEEVDSKEDADTAAITTTLEVVSTHIDDGGIAKQTQTLEDVDDGFTEVNVDVESIGVESIEDNAIDLTDLEASADSNDDDDEPDVFDDEEVEALLEEPEPPHYWDVAKVAVNNLLLILVALFCFTLSSAEGGKYVDGMSDATFFHGMAAVAAPIFPLLIFLYSLIRIILPWSNRKMFWKIISLTTNAPLHKVTFRDGFVGDILTSSVRPMQDSSFTLFYMLSGLRGWWEQSYDLDAADRPLEKNWILHTWILPMCVASPLWWRFAQNLRQSYDTKQRWPYLGNAMKYFLAAEIALFGIYNPEQKQTVIWLASFVGATLYQIWWDTFMDWNLFEVSRAHGIRFRKERIYRSSVYVGIFCVNFVLRFCWTLSFLPRHYLNKAGILSSAFEGDLSVYLNPAIASAEIIRRTLWGLLRVENEAIKVSKSNPKLREAHWSSSVALAPTPLATTSDDHENAESAIELTTMAVVDETPTATPQDTKATGMWISNDMSMLQDLQILGELSFYAIAFSALGMLAAYHRDIL